MTAVASPQHAEWSWVWSPHPDVLLLVVSLGAAYVWALRTAGARGGSGRAPATRSQKASFFAGLGVLWAGADWPVHDIAEGYLYSVHMVQHLVFSLVAPPLMLLGMPRWMLRSLLRPPAVSAVVRAVTRPVVALVLFNAVALASHMPDLVELSVTSGVSHFLIHVVLVGSAFAMWWPVVGPLPEFPRLHDPARLLYLFLLSVPPTVPGAFLTFAREPVYRIYAEFPRSFGVGVLSDQLFAGLLMKLGAGALLWGTIAVLFFRWSAREERGEMEDVSWDDFEHELEALKLRK